LERKPSFVQVCQRIETIAEVLWAFGEAEKAFINEDGTEEGGSSETGDVGMGSTRDHRPSTRGSIEPPQGKGAGGRSNVSSVPSKLLRFLHRPLRWQDIEALGVRVRPPVGGDEDGAAATGGTSSVLAL